MNEFVDYLVESGIYSYQARLTEIDKFILVGGVRPSTFVAKNKEEIPSIEVESNSYTHKTRKEYVVGDIVDYALTCGIPILNASKHKNECYEELGAIKREIDEKKKELSKLTDTITSIDVVRHEGVGRYIACEDVIVSSAICYHDIVLCGVYFLVDNGVISYVGQSVNIPARIKDHVVNEEKTFDSVSYIRCPKEKLDILESFYIRTLAPRDNKAHPPIGHEDFAKILFGTTA